MANQINPKKLLHSKWTKVKPNGKEKHFIVSKLNLTEDNQLIDCELEAVINKHVYHTDWHDLKNSDNWLMGWK